MKCNTITKSRIAIKRTLIIIICNAVALSVLSGCQLAKENADGSVYEDRLVGVFITLEHLDLFDYESFLNSGSGFRGSEISIDGRAQEYQGRLYATQVTRTDTDAETGAEIQREDFVFEGLDGIAFFSPRVLKTPEYESYTTTIIGEAVSNAHISIYVGDDTNSRSMEGTLFYIARLYTDQAIYLNPVYQSTDGSVYLMSGDGFFTSGFSSEGTVMTQTLEVTTTIMENGISKTESMSVSVAVSVMFAPEKIVVLQMDANGTLISRAEYEPDTMPEALTPEIATAYIVVETFKCDNEGYPVISRGIYDNSNDNFDTFFAVPDGICIKHSTQIIW